MSDFPFELPEGWCISEAQEYCAKVADGTHDSPKRVENGKSLVTSKHITGGRLDLTYTYNISEEDFELINKRSKVDIYDVLLSMIGTVGQPCLIDKEPDFAIKNVGLLKNDNPVKAKWLYFFLLTPVAQQMIKERLRGTTQQYLPLGEIRKFPIPHPKSELEMLRRIEIISAIHEKIELNRQINQTLEQIAQVIFKSWFVDFEPTHAKIAAKQNGQDPERAAMAAISGKTLDELDQLSPEQQAQLKATAVLFSDTFVDSELGEIPEGWEVKNIGALVKRLKSKKRYTKKQVKPFGLVPVYEQGADILLGYHDEKSGFIASPEKPLFIFGDHTCVIHLSCENFDISQNVIPLSGKNYPTIWVYYAVQGKQEFQEYRRHWSEFIIKKLIVPSTALTEEYAKLTTSLYKQKEQLVRENKILEQLRDAILPKLLSGELSVEPNQMELEQA